MISQKWLIAVKIMGFGVLELDMAWLQILKSCRSPSTTLSTYLIMASSKYEYLATLPHYSPWQGLTILPGWQAGKIFQSIGNRDMGAGHGFQLEKTFQCNLTRLPLWQAGKIFQSIGNRDMGAGHGFQLEKTFQCNPIRKLG